MNRRQTRLYGDLALLASNLETLAIDESARPARDEAVAILNGYLLPRIKDSPPLVVALVGSTGAGKSTLLNSLAGEVVSMPGALRPTTKRARVWANELEAENLGHLGPVSVGSHPLLDHLALVDTPDLDSDLVEHRAEALAVSQAADVIVFITTAARYGDQLVWSTLQALVKVRPVAIVLNRVPSRASGARNDLLARLGRADLGHLPVFSISEQRIDPARKRLRTQSVQRLAGFLRELNASDRSQGMDQAADRVADLLGPLRIALQEEQERLGSARQSLEDELERVNHHPVRRRWRLFKGSSGTEAKQEVDALTAELGSLPSFDEDALEQIETGWQALAEARFD